jgi:hypothetical protein
VADEEREEQRKERLARNESLFREVNERVREVNDRVTEVNGDVRSDRIEFLCECGDPRCTESISLSREEYEQLRSDPLLFAVEPGHEIEEVEEVVAVGERFNTVRKLGSGARVARKTDPRA